MKRRRKLQLLAGTTIAATLLVVLATAAGACHVTTNCYTAELVSDRKHDMVLVRHADWFHQWINVGADKVETIANNTVHGYVTDAWFHSGAEHRTVARPYGNCNPTTTTTVAPTTTTTVAPTTTTTEVPTSTTTVPPTTTSTSTLPPNPTTSAPPTSSSTTVPPAAPSSSALPSTTSSTVVMLCNPDDVVCAPSEELPDTGTSMFWAWVGFAAFAVGLVFAIFGSRKKGRA